MNMRNSVLIIQFWGWLFLSFMKENQLFAQSVRSLSREFSFKTDNDAYLLKKNDAYYTNGLFLNYSFSAQSSRSKKIRSFEIGQKIFTPLKRATINASDIDRPYCGYLFTKYTQQVFLKQESIFSWAFSLAIVGPNSGAEALQNSYHKLLNYAKFRGWQYQINNSVGLDAELFYAKTVFSASSIKITPTIQAELGMMQNIARMGTMIQLGRFDKNSQSTIWNARVNQPADSYTKELFLYSYPELILQGFNITLQGGLLNQDYASVTKEPSRQVFQHTTGICYANKRFSSNFAVVYQSKETPSQLKPHRYASLRFAYRFR